MTDIDQASQQQAGRTDELRASAAGWQRIQIALLGFIGLCGVLKGTGASEPRPIQVIAAILILLALLIACYATLLVGRVAWPLYLPDRQPPADSSATGADDLQRTSRRLRTGLYLTFVALILATAAATSSWWPGRAVSSANLVTVSTTGGTICGTLSTGANGSLVLRSSGQSEAIPFSDVLAVNPTSSCG